MGVVQRTQSTLVTSAIMPLKCGDVYFKADTSLPWPVALVDQIAD